MPAGKRIQVSLTEEEHGRLMGLAEKHDASVGDLIHKAIRQAYLNESDRDLALLDVQRLGDTPLLMDEEEEAIGMRGPRVLPKQVGRAL
ncbi:MAG TPA: hypothetical protein VMW79_11785 [Anaerolineae bacterium]|nr:hypothetical protein [Anaerolineae bacterium]